MGDGGSVGATRAIKLDGGGVRVSMSFSRGEAWLLKQLLLSARDPVRMRELTEDPYYTKILQKASGLLKRAEAEALLVGPVNMERRSHARARQIRHDCKAAIDAGQDWSVVDYAREHGISKRVVASLTLKMRKEAGLTRTSPRVHVQPEQGYDSSKEAAE
jgi:hypothetical protein